jgi:hypothetical protein
MRLQKESTWLCQALRPEVPAAILVSLSVLQRLQWLLSQSCCETLIDTVRQDLMIEKQ